MAGTFSVIIDLEIYHATYSLGKPYGEDAKFEAAKQAQGVVSLSWR